MSKVSVLTVTYGNRWKFLLQVADSVISDPFLYKLIIIDNASENKSEIDEFKNNHQNKIHIIRNDTNLGSAGGFAKGLEYARNLDCDYVLLLDDDNVPEVGFSEKFIANVGNINEKNSVLLGNRSSLKANEKMFYDSKKVSDKIPNTFFEVFSIKKFKYFLNLFKNKQKLEGEFKSIVEVESFAYGGTFLPIRAIKDSPIPDAKLFSYGDDIEYSWGVRHAGYRIFLCSSPIIKDVDLTFRDSHITDLFSEKTSNFKVFFRMRNMALISMKNTKAKFRLKIETFVWYLALCFYGVLKLGLSKTMIKKSVLIFKALSRGLRLDYSVPEYITVPGLKNKN